MKIFSVIIRIVVIIVAVVFMFIIFTPHRTINVPKLSPIWINKTSNASLGPYSNHVIIGRNDNESGTVIKLWKKSINGEQFPIKTKKTQATILLTWPIVCIHQKIIINEDGKITGVINTSGLDYCTIRYWEIHRCGYKPENKYVDIMPPINWPDDVKNGGDKMPKIPTPSWSEYKVTLEVNN